MCFCAFIYIDKIDDKFLRAIKWHKIKKTKICNIFNVQYNHK